MASRAAGKKRAKRQAAAERQRQGDMVSLLRQLSEEQGLDVDDNVRALPQWKAPPSAEFLARAEQRAKRARREHVGRSETDALDNEDDNEEQTSNLVSFFDLLRDLRAEVLTPDGPVPTERPAALRAWLDELVVAGQEDEDLRELVRHLRPHLQRLAQTLSAASRTPLSPKAALLAMVDLRCLLFKAYYACIQHGGSPLRACALLSRDDTVMQPPDLVDLYRAALPKPAKRRARRLAVLEAVKAVSPRAWRAFRRTWGLTDTAQWVKPRHPNQLLALARLQFDEATMLAAASELLALNLHCDSEAARRQTPRPAPPLLLEWDRSAREWPTIIYDSLIPNDAALDALAGCPQPVLQLGAGTGYWASLLEAYGVKVACHDPTPPHEGPHSIHLRAPEFVQVANGGLSVANSPDHPTLLLNAADARPGGALGGDLALGSLQRFRGSHVVLIGEWRPTTEPDAAADGSADPARDAPGAGLFEAALCKDFVLQQRVSLPAMPYQAPALWVFVRKTEQATGALSLDEPTLAGARTTLPPGAQLWRCQFCHAFVVDGDAAAQKYRAEHEGVHILRSIRLRRPTTLTTVALPHWVPLSRPVLATGTSAANAVPWTDADAAGDAPAET